MWTFSLARKSDVFEKFLAFRAHILTQFERNIKNFQCDNGREFDNGSFWDLCKTNGMSFRLSCPHTFGLSIICLVLFLLMPLFLLPFGIMHYKWLHIFLIYFQVRFWETLLLFKFYTNGIPRILTLGCLGVYAILSFQPPQSINYNLPHVCFWVILRIIVATSVMIYLLVKL